MSGHSKWSKIKNQKAVTDVKKATAFTRATRAILAAVREGGGIVDPDKNFRLRLAIDKAKSVNMPKDNIDRLLTRASGTLTGVLTELLYEAYGPGNIGFLIEILTDNSNRAFSNIRNIIERAGGVVTGKGAVSHLFSQKGNLVIEASGKSFDDIFAAAVNAGAQDIISIAPNIYRVITAPEQLFQVHRFLESSGNSVKESLLAYEPIVTKVIADISNKNAVEGLIKSLEELDDVQHVWTNYSQ
jgi:YebC/PmpR family DNA-binding regulatory protein